MRSTFSAHMSLIVVFRRNGKRDTANEALQRRLRSLLTRKEYRDVIRRTVHVCRGRGVSS
jgi:hypothetical protein